MYSFLQLFLRIYVEMYPEREPELLLRMSEGRFDIGGTFTEGYESSMLNESETPLLRLVPDHNAPLPYTRQYSHDKCMWAASGFWNATPNCQMQRLSHSIRCGV